MNDVTDPGKSSECRLIVSMADTRIASEVYWGLWTGHVDSDSFSRSHIFNDRWIAGNEHLLKSIYSNESRRTWGHCTEWACLAQWCNGCKEFKRSLYGVFIYRHQPCTQQGLTGCSWLWIHSKPGLVHVQYIVQWSCLFLAMSLCSLFINSKV